MKTKTTKLLLLASIFMLPVFLKAQWNHVRFDQANTFHKVFAATADDAFVIGTGPTTGEYFMIRTADGGGTWDSININTTSTYSLNEMYFKDVNNGFVGGYENNTNQVLLKTTDNGTTWTEITPDPAATDGITAIYFVTPLTGFAASYTAFYSTTNGGVTWTTYPTTFHTTDINFADMNNGYVTGDDGMQYGVMMKTSDGGQTWTNCLAATDPNLFIGNLLKQDVLASGTIFTSLAYTNKLFKSTDGGLTWDTIVVDSVWAIYDFQFTSPLLGHVLSNMGQIFVTNDGGQTWALEYATEWGFYGPSINLYSLSFVGEIGYVAGTSGLVKRHDETNSIHEAEHHSGMNIYPNPLSGTQDLFIQAENSGESVINIMNTVGQVVFTKSIANSQAGSMIIRSGLNLPAGTYFLNVESSKGRNTEKLMIVE